MDKKIVVETTIHNCSCHKQLNQANERIAELVQNIRDMKYWAESGYPTQTIKIADEALQQTDKE